MHLFLFRIFVRFDVWAADIYEACPFLNLIIAKRPFRMQYTITKREKVRATVKSWDMNENNEDNTLFHQIEQQFRGLKSK